MNWTRSAPVLCLILSLILISFISVSPWSGSFAVPAAGISHGINWANLHGVAYRSALYSYPCYEHLPGCDSPIVAPPSLAFQIYKKSGFNFARIGLDWGYMEQNQSGFESILANTANQCDANGIYCYYLFGGNTAATPSDVIAAWGCSTHQCYASHFVSNSVIPPGTGTPYDGQHVWTALWNGLFKPALQTLDSHPSTAGYSTWNEPGGIFSWTPAELASYYDYMGGQIRTLSSKAIIFQCNAGGDGCNWGTSSYEGPSGSLAPLVFEIHNYQGVLNYNPYGSAVSSCAAQPGCTAVLLGEWGGTTNPPSGYKSMNQYMTDELNVVKQEGMANEWFDYSGLEASSATGALNPTGQLLSQLDNQILGSGGKTTFSTIATTSQPATTATTTQPTTTSGAQTTAVSSSTQPTFTTSSTGISSATGSNTVTTITTSSSAISLNSTSPNFSSNTVTETNISRNVISSNSIAPSDNSTTGSIGRSNAASSSPNFFALFGSIPFVTTSPTPLALSIFASELGVLVVVFAVVRKTIRSRNNRDSESGPE